MELWFILTIVSAFTAGIGSFTHKVAAETHYDSALLTAQASILSFLLLLVCTVVFSDFSHWWHLSTLLAGLTGMTYFVVLILKIEVLKHIDAAIFFPIYKVMGPLMAIGLGLFFFEETFSYGEWLGLGLSLLVPLLLITKSENQRQKNLYRGLVMLLLASIIGSISVAFSKWGADTTSNIWLYLLLIEVTMVGSALARLAQKSNLRKLVDLNVFRERSKRWLVMIMGCTQFAGGALMIFAFSAGGTLGIVYMINSLYILIPIVLSIIYYHEHWNARKIAAIILSALALGLLH